MLHQHSKVMDIITLIKHEQTSCNTSCVNLDDYKKLKEEHLVQMKKHPTLPLTLLNYTPKTQMKKKWCAELLQARGLVVNDDGVIVARPISKFFNDYELQGSFPTGLFEVYEKLDGSLIIMSFFNGKPFFCTRGSFTSEQSLKAKEIYNKKYTENVVDQEYTYCFEIIYPQNKIIINYRGEEDMFLLAKIHTRTGKEAPIIGTGFKSAELHRTTSLNELKQMDEINKEGFVVKFLEFNFRMKIKFQTYISLHKMKGNLSRKQIIELIKSESVPNIPDESFDELNNHIKQLELEFKEKDDQLVRELENILENAQNEKELISMVKMSPHASILFNMYRNKQYKHLVWNLMK